MSASRHPPESKTGPADSQSRDEQAGHPGEPRPEPAQASREDFENDPARNPDGETLNNIKGG